MTPSPGATAATSGPKVVVFPRPLGDNLLKRFTLGDPVTPQERTVFDFTHQIIIVLVIALLVFGPRRLRAPTDRQQGLRGLGVMISLTRTTSPSPRPRPAPRPRRPQARPRPRAPGPVDRQAADEVLRGVVAGGAEPPATGSGERA